MTGACATPSAIAADGAESVTVLMHARFVALGALRSEMSTEKVCPALTGPVCMAYVDWACP